MTPVSFRLLHGTVPELIIAVVAVDVGDYRGSGGTGSNTVPVVTVSPRRVTGGRLVAGVLQLAAHFALLEAGRDLYDGGQWGAGGCQPNELEGPGICRSLAGNQPSRSPSLVTAGGSRRRSGASTSPTAAQ